MIKKVPRYLLTFFNTSGAIAVERFCKEREIPGRLIPVPREDFSKLWPFLGGFAGRKGLP